MRVVVIVVLIAIAPASFAAGSAPAENHDHTRHNHNVPDRPNSEVTAPPVAHRLWHDLVCLCGECDRLTLATCQCPTAARERENILAALRSRDLSTEALSQAAYQAVVEDYARRFKGQNVFRAATAEPSRSWIGWTLLGLWVAMIAGAALSTVKVRRRRSAQASPRRTSHRRRP